MSADPIAAGRKGGKSRSPRKLAACRRNGFQKIYNVTAAEILNELTRPVEPRLLVALEKHDVDAREI
jgi:hypothetical protein